MTKHTDGFALTYPPRDVQAAAYLSMSRSMFLKLVNEGVMPPPVKIRSMTTWDRLDLDAAYEDLKDKPFTENSVHRALREMKMSKAVRKQPWSSRESKSYRDK